MNANELRALTQESLETDRGIASLEQALSSLYKALLVGRGQYLRNHFESRRLMLLLSQAAVKWQRLSSAHRNTKHTICNSALGSPNTFSSCSSSRYGYRPLTNRVELITSCIYFQCEIALGLAANAIKNSTLEIPRHSQLEDKLGKYCGLVLYMKEMDEERYQKLCAVSESMSAKLSRR